MISQDRNRSRVRWLGAALRIKFGIAAAFALLSLVLGGVAKAQQSGMTFFVTSAGAGRGADFGGLEGADRHCQGLAIASGALISASVPPPAPRRSTRAIVSAAARGETRKGRSSRAISTNCMARTTCAPRLP